MAAAQWLVGKADEEASRRLVNELGLAPVAARVLVRRGYTNSSQAREFLHPGFDSLHRPELLKGMDQAVDRLLRAAASDEPVLLYGDYDVDGTLSIVLLEKAIELAGGSAIHHVPHRLREGYGMREDVIRAAAAQGIRLVVSVDTGIRAAEVVRCANSLGVDVIVTDHHLPEAEIPPAMAVINPNQPGCGYPEKNLCGAAVAFKLAQSLLERSGLGPDRLAALLRSFLRLVAIATVADVVALAGENRAIVKQGLDGLTRSANPGLRALFAVAGIQPGAAVSAGQVAFRIAPRINAAGRMASALEVIELFLTADEGRAKEIAARLNDWNADRQRTEAGMLDEILASCEAEPVDDSRRGLVLARAGWHRGVAGIVASRLVERFHRPVFVLGIDEEKGEAQGSGRSVPGFHLLEALESMAGIFTRFGGHKQAAGVTLPVGQLAEFQLRFNEFACSHLAPSDLVARYQVDSEVSLAELNGKAVADLFSIAPFGLGNPSPALVVRGARITDPPLVMKERHLRFRAVQNGASWIFKAWHWAGRVDQLAPGRPLDLLFTLEDDSGGVSASLKDVRAAASPETP